MARVGVQQLLSQVLSRFETVSRIAVAQRAPRAKLPTRSEPILRNPRRSDSSENSSLTARFCVSVVAFMGCL